MNGAWTILGYIIYDIWVFWIDDTIILAGLLLISLLVWGISQWHNPEMQRQPPIGSCGFIIFVMLCNWLFCGLIQALKLGIKLWLILRAGQALSRLMSAEEIAQGIASLCRPLQIFRVDVVELSLSITVALAFLPLLAQESKQLKTGLALKGYRFNLRSLLRAPQVYVVGIIRQLFGCIESTEIALRLKGYD